MKAQLDSNQKAITKKLRALVPDATAIIFHGSRVRGIPSSESDYDVLVLAPRGVGLEVRKQIKDMLGASFPGIQIDPAFGSERWMRANLGREPHLRFWLENGIASFGYVPQVKKYPPFYKDALKVKVDLIQARRLMVAEWGRMEYGKARTYLALLKELILIENALHGNYQNDALWDDIRELVGVKLLTILRNPKRKRSIRKAMVSHLLGILDAKIKSMRRQLAAANRPSLVTLHDA
jgi:predicted nucleotidyltransferase